MKNAFKNLARLKFSQKTVLLLLSLALILNIPDLSKEVERIRLFKTFNPHQNIGYELLGIKSQLKDVATIGYYTDGDIKNENENKNYSVAQYVLAPTVVEPDNLDYEYVLFVCADENNALRKIREIGAEPLLRGHSGMILARKR